MKLLGIAALAALSLGCSSAGGGTATSGLQGRVMRGPITPVCYVNQPCEAPTPGVKLLFYRSGKLVARVTTNAKGRYRVALKPGAYSVRMRRTTFGKTMSPARASVPRARFKRLDFHIDTGLR